MKKFAPLLLSFLLLTHLSRAQYVNLPDNNFLDFIQVNYPSCVSFGQLDTTCSEILTADSITIGSFWNITNLEGIEYFKSLTYLSYAGADESPTMLTYLPALPNTLTYLDCSYSNLSSLPALPLSLTYLDCSHTSSLVDSPNSLPTTLTYLDCNSTAFHLPSTLPNSLTFLNCEYSGQNELPPLPDSLTFLECSDNYPLHSLPALPKTLQWLSCNDDGVDSLPSPLPISLTYLNCYYDNLTSLPALPPLLITLICYENSLTTLPALPNSLTYIECSSNNISTLPKLPDSLTYLSCGGNALTALPPLPNSLNYINCTYNALTALPPLPNSLNYIYCDNNDLYCFPRIPNSVLNISFDTLKIKCLPNTGNYSIYDGVNDTSSFIPYPICNYTNNPNNCPVYIDTTNVHLCPPKANTTITSNVTGSTYQWQLNTGSGFTNIIEGGDYDSSRTASLNIFNIPSSWYGYQYRCIVGVDTSATFIIQFSDSWTGSVNSLWENPSNWSCGSLPDSNTDVIINSGLTNYPVLSFNTTIRSLMVNPNASFTITPPYTLTITH